MLDVFRGTLTVRKALNLIDHLPSTSNYIAAIAEDEDLADSVPDDPSPARGPRLTEWSPEVAALAAIVDRLGALINVQVARGGGAPAKVNPYPRPVTAAQKIKERRRLERHEALVARLLPNRNQ